MKVIDRNGNILTEYDLSVGNLFPSTTIRPEATPIDNITKFAWYDDDYEDVLVYTPIPEEMLRPSQLDIIEAQVTYTALMTDTLLEGR